MYEQISRLEDQYVTNLKCFNHFSHVNLSNQYQTIEIN